MVWYVLPLFEPPPNTFPYLFEGIAAEIAGVRQVKFGVKNRGVILNPESMKTYDTWFWAAFCSFTQDSKADLYLWGGEAATSLPNQKHLKIGEK